VIFNLLSEESTSLVLTHMEGDFEEEPEGSPNEESGSNLNEESFIDNTEQQEGDS